MTTLRSRSAVRDVRRGDTFQRHRIHRGICITAIGFTTFGVAMAPSAVADSTGSLRAAVAASRVTACGPLRSDPAVDQAAADVNESTDKWIDNTSRAVPETDALSILKDLGYGGSKAAILSGAAHTDADAIKAILLQGYAKIPDCSYADFGVSALYNAKKDLVLTTVVLAA
jgi:hypothetical protein